MPAYVHGGDVYTYATRYGGAPLDLSANINPFGTPEGVRQAMQDALSRCACYPDPFCRAARRAISAAEGAPADWLYCGNGAADVLDRLAAALRPRTALLTVPTFAAYERTLAGAQLRFHPLRVEEEFTLTGRLLDDIVPGLDAVYLCNPNNPTGRTADPALLRAVARRCAANGTWLVVDECFSDFLTDSAQHTLKDLLGAQPRLVLLRAYTKMYAVPGVRFGWCMTANAALVDALYRAGQPWNVSVIAQACAEAAAREQDYAQRTAARIADERAYLAEELQRRGLNVYKSEVNFLLFRAAEQDLQQQLAARGVLLRSMLHDRGLGAGWYRTAVKTRQDSRTLLAALDEIRREER